MLVFFGFVIEAVIVIAIGLGIGHIIDRADHVNIESKGNVK
jgi:hypothetical protein